jgi:hypothetical protein
LREAIPAQGHGFSAGDFLSSTLEKTMSHHICYEHLPVLFPKEDLVAAIDHWSFYEDRYLLLELGGSNNCSTFHPVTGREVGARNWSADAYGQHYEVMREAVRRSAACEGGGMRLSGEKHTLPEGYIRRVRNLMKHPVLWTDLNRFGYGLTVTAKIPVPDESETSWPDEHKAMLNRHARIVEKQEGAAKRTCWHLNVVHSAMDAALLMLYGYHVSGPAWNLVSVDGPRFECEGRALFERLRSRRVA